MALPDLSMYCTTLTVVPQDLTITFPGGASLSAQLPGLGFPDPTQLAKQLMAEASAAIAPLTPVFHLIDVVLALHQAVKAIPDAISHLDPSKISDALPDVARKVGTLLPLVPQLSVPLLLLGLVDALLVFLEGFTTQLQVIIEHQARIQRAADRAALLNNEPLAIVVNCARGQVDAQVASLAQSFGELHRMIGLANALARLAGLSFVPSLPDLGSDAQDALTVLQEVIRSLQSFRRSIPV